MGDHRASIKIEMEFHGVKDSLDAWINYVPLSCCDMDERVVEFFRRVYYAGMEKFEAERAAAELEKNKDEIEKSEREEYERLKTKYEK